MKNPWEQPLCHLANSPRLVARWMTAIWSTYPGQPRHPEDTLKLSHMLSGWLEFYDRSQKQNIYVVVAVVQSLSRVQLFSTPWIVAYQAPLSSTISWSLLKFMSIQSGMLSNLLIFCCPLLLLPSIFPSIRVFSWCKPAFHVRWLKYWSFNFSISPSIEFQGWCPLGLTGLIFLQSKGFSRVFSSTTIWKFLFFGTQISLRSNSHICIWLLEKP